jgi:TolB-like protein/Tfp pilus assembly protein PilF
MIGQTVSHYRILAKLGEGGMGVVYKAQDLTLDRTAALKFLPPHLGADESAKTRFIREAKSASALDHPNISIVFEVGETPDGQLFIAMPFYEGETLSEKVERGPLPVADALDLTLQVASGLAKAHQKGIVHRDIKGGNVIVTDDGVAKVVDFGLAKQADTTKVTQTGMTVGTVAYMSPEQAQGKDTDHRTDIWSLGVVMYELLAGRLPFEGDVNPALMYSIFNQDPEPLTAVRPEVPLEVERVVAKALEKDAKKRYQSFEQFIEELEDLRERLDLLPRRSRAQLKVIRNRRRIAGAMVAAVAVAIVAWALYEWVIKPDPAAARLAVLPCEIIGGDATTDYLSNSVTDDMISQLAKIGSLQPLNILSVLKYKGTTQSPREIGTELNIGWLVRPSVRVDGNRLEIFVQLIDTRSETVGWAEEYTRDLADLTSLSRYVALQTAGAIGVRVSDDERQRLAEAPRVDPDAYGEYQKGRDLWRRRTVDRALLDQSLAHFERAVVIDPDYALAHAGLADAYAMIANPIYRYGTMSYTESLRKHDQYMEKAREAVTRALQLDPDLAEAHAAKAVTMRWTDLAGAEAAFQRSIELGPNYAWTHHWYSDWLSSCGRHEEAIEHEKRAVELLPGISFVRAALGARLTCARRYDEAAVELEAAAEIDPGDSQTHIEWFLFHLSQERYDEAYQSLKRYLEIDGLDPDMMTPIYRAQIGQIPAEEAFPLIEGLERSYGTLWSSLFYAMLGEFEAAVLAVERGYNLRDPLIPRFVNRVVAYDPLRSDPRFIEILDGLGLTATAN